MKKAMAVLLFFVLVTGIVGAFPFASAYYSQSLEGAKYSGGNGTEDDPYLLSTSNDIEELCDNIKNDPSIWYTKYYYKLTNDIETSYSLDIPSCSTKFSLSSFQTAGESIRSSRLIPIYRHIEGEEPRGDYISAFTADKDMNGYYNEYFINYMGEGYPWYVTNVDYYWNAGFTGVFDGNGYTIKLDKDGYFFGFIENEAVIKDLTVEGDNASFAYCVDQTSMVLNCRAKGSAIRDAIAYNYGMVVDAVTDDGFAYTVTENSEIYINALLEYSDTVVIPETIGDMPVVGIGHRAFVFRDIDIDRLYIPGSIREIATYAFSYDGHKAAIETICYNGTSRMLGYIFEGPNHLKSELWELYEVEYDYEPIEGVALKGGETCITLDIGETFRPEYEYYPENGRGFLTYSFEGNSISVKDGLIKGLNQGETTVTVTAESGVEYDFTVKVIGYTKLVIDSLPNKVNYSLRSSLDTTGLVVRAVRNDGTDREITEYTVSGYNALKKGVQNVTLTFNGLTASFQVFVYDAVIGDTNGDEYVSAIDSNLMKRIIGGQIFVEEKTDEFFACDIDGDGTITPADSFLLKKMLAGQL